MNWTDLFKNIDLEKLKEIVITNGEYKGINEISFINDGILKGLSTMEGERSFL